jgi:hypothetical protein
MSVNILLLTLSMLVSSISRLVFPWHRTILLPRSVNCLQMAAQVSSSDHIVIRGSQSGGSSVTIVTRLQAKRMGFDTRQEIFSTASCPMGLFRCG